MTQRPKIGGIIHTYQKYNPTEFPHPLESSPDLVSAAFDMALAFGDYREISEEQLAKAIRLDPSQLAGFGPSIDQLRRMLEEKKRRILEKYETDYALKRAARGFDKSVQKAKPPEPMRQAFRKATQSEQIYALERLWYQLEDDHHPFARSLVHIMEALSSKYQVEELHSKYAFTGHERMEVEEAIEIKKVLEKIDELLKQLDEAEKTAQIGVIDMDALSEFAEPQDLNSLQEWKHQLENYMRELAERQGLTRDTQGRYRLSPSALKVMQNRLLATIFGHLLDSRSGRHAGRISGEGSVELPATRSYDFGDSCANMDVVQTLTNYLIRTRENPSPLHPEDIEIHRTLRSPKCATAVIMDMSGSMRYDGQYMNVKRMALALQGLIQSQYPGDILRFIEMYTFAKVRAPGEILNLMPKPVTIHDPWVRLKADMSDDTLSEQQVHPHFTNIQHGLRLARQLLSAVETKNKQIVLITDGLPTAHFEDQWLYMLYPPDPRTEEATMREGRICSQFGITINIFLVPSWSQSEEDIRFAYRLAESTKGRVFFTAGKDLDRFVVWDYLERKRQILG
ncbi:MAG: VWA domain-containing protein [Pirellulales bacterium]